MKSSQALTPATRVLDVGAPDADVARDLAEWGLTRYLGLVEPDELAKAQHRAGPFANRLQPLGSHELVFRCSADLLILRCSHIRLLWAVPGLGHVTMVAVERSSGPARIEVAAAALTNRAAKKLIPRGELNLAGQVFDLFETVRRHGPAPRTYLSPVWGTVGLSERLETAGFRYVVLRWFDSLPAMEPGEDLDILVADDDLAAFRALLEEEPGTIPVDLYSASGLPYSDYQGAAYYPPALAERILIGARQHVSGFRVPGPEDHLHSLAYHAAYHKGPRSGIESELCTPESAPEHDYPTVLAQLAAEHGIDPPTTLEEWDDYLTSVGWQPSPDALRKLAPSNPWVAARLVPHPPPAADGAELAVFLVREEALAVTELREVLRVLEHFGFDVIVTHELSETERERCAAIVRGGNWGRGPFPRSGGPPAVMLVALHYAPGQLWDELRERYPHLTNADVLGVKLRLRDLVESQVDADRAFNPVHSADNEHEAWEYLATATPGLVAQVRAAVAERRCHLELDVPAVRSLSKGRRARVDIIDGPEGPVVRKTYAPRFVRHLQREVSVMHELSGMVAAVPPVLDQGPNWFSCPYYTDTLGDFIPGRLIPLEVLREMVGVLRDLHAHGYDLVDAKPQNFVLDPDAGLKVVDFEFAHKYGTEGSPPLADTMNFVGPGPGYRGDVPVGDQAYERLWLPYTGLPREVLTDGTPMAQQAHRMLFRLRHLTLVPGSPLRRPLGRARRAARHLRWLAGRHFARWATQRAGTVASAR